MGEEDQVKKVLHESPEVDIKMGDWFDCTPLAYAVYCGHLSLVIHLLQKGANPYHTVAGRHVLSFGDRHPHFKEFCSELQAVALAVSPPATGMNPSLLKKVCIVLTYI